MTLQIALVLTIFAATVVLFVSDLVRVDIIAIMVMLSLAWLKLVEPAEAFAGFASHAVIAIIAVMILGHGVDRSGAMNRIALPIIRRAKSNERHLIGYVSTTVGLASAFMQNIAAAALFLPTALKISKRTGIPASRLLMPMGFAAILGGNLSMVGSTPLLMLNDLLRHNGQKPFGLFSVTPIGAALLAVGIICFIVWGQRLLPPADPGKKKALSPQQQLIKTWKLPTTIYQCIIPSKSPLVGKTREEAELWSKYKLNLLALAEGNDVLYAPWRHTPFAAGQKLALLGDQTDLVHFVSDYELMYKKDLTPFGPLGSTESVGFAEMIIPVRSSVIGHTLQEVALRKTYGVEPIMLLSGDREERGDFSDWTLQAGEAVIVHGRWSRIKAMADTINFVLATPVETRKFRTESRPLAATLCFIGAIILALSGVPLALGLMTGALVMILLGIISIDDAYKAIDWRTVFLLAGLIPLGIAMDRTGAALYIAQGMMHLLQGSSPIVILLAVACLSTVLALFMSNAAATVLLVPLVMIMGHLTGLDARALALLVALCASNCFILPTHHVNVLIMSPGGYRNIDFVRAGGIMTIIYILISVGFVYFMISKTV